MFYILAAPGFVWAGPPIINRVCEPQEILHRLIWIMNWQWRSSVEQQRFYETVQPCLHKSLVFFWQCSNASSALPHALLILLLILRWTSSQMASSWLDPGLCMSTTEACIMMSPCSVKSQASAEHDLDCCVHDTVFSNATWGCPLSPTGHLPHHNSYFRCGLSYLQRELSHWATWQCQSHWKVSMLSR